VGIQYVLYINRSQKQQEVESGSEAAQFLSWEYINRILFAVFRTACMPKLPICRLHGERWETKVKSSLIN
jgi:hypothetical protein